MKHLHLTCAIIERDGLVLAAQRSATMNLPLKWDVPGGKIDSGETAETCLKRELVEEMGVRVGVGLVCRPALTNTRISRSRFILSSARLNQARLLFTNTLP